MLNRFGYQPEQPGVYVTAQPLLEKVVLLVLNELRDEPQNEFLRLFASRQQVRKQTIDSVLHQRLSNWPEQFWVVLFGLQRVYQLEDTAMKRAMTVEDVMEIGAELRKQAIASASPEERLAGLAPEERLAGLTHEEMATMLEQIEALLAKQTAGPPPASKIEQELTCWNTYPPTHVCHGAIGQSTESPYRTVAQPQFSTPNVN